MKFLKHIFSKKETDNLEESKNPASKEDSNSRPIQKTDKEATNTSSLNKLRATHTGITRIVDTQAEEDTLVLQEQFAKKSPASLLLLNGPKDLMGQSWALTNPVTNVGRSHRLNEVPIKHNSLSKTHFQILKDMDDKFYLVDLKSTNKTYINDELVEPYQKIALKNNDYIRASSLIFKFLDQGNIEFFSSRQTLDKAQTDPLTGAGNRQLLKIKGNEYFLSNKKLSLIVFDIDDFKTINDSFGHSAGDYVLKTLCKHILKTIREGDMFIRYGGDEFCIFTPNSFSIASNIADRIKQIIQTHDFIFENQKIKLDISLGLAEKEPKDKAWEDIYQRADKKSYEEKRRKKSF